MRRRLDALKALRDQVSAYADSLNEKALEEWLARRARWLAALAANRAVQAEIAAARRHIAAEQEDKDLALEGVREARQEIERLTPAIAAHAAKSGRDLWAQNLKNIDEHSAMMRDAIRKRMQAASNLAPLSGALGEESVLKTYCDLAAARLPADFGQLRKAERAFRDAAPAVAAKVEARRREVSAELVQLDREVAELRQALQQGHEPASATYLTRETKLLIRRLESAGMDARPLCDLVEIVDPAWIPAVEALLGRDREAVFVERPRIRDATALFRDGRREFKGASLVSLNKLDQYREPPRSDTFPSLFRTDDPDAMAFLQRRYGTVRLARTLDEFNLPGRALMQDGLYDDGLVRSHRSVDPREHKIGKTAQAEHFRHMQDAFAETSGRLSTLLQKDKVLGSVLGALAFLVEDEMSLADRLAKVQDWSAERADVEARIADLVGRYMASRDQAAT